MSAGTCVVMGILNVTPDSFSDGGRWDSIDAAIARGIELQAEGADVVDVGGESTRPGAVRVAPDVERSRVRPVIAALVAEGVRVSIDTTRAQTAATAIEVGAIMVNDISGGLADEAMAAVVAGTGVEYVAMHWRASATEMDAHDHYGDVVTDVRDELATRVDALVRAGIDAERIILDPGLGFSKVAKNNWPLLAHLDALEGLGHRVLIGASRKRFLGAVIADDSGPAAREHATTAVTTLAAFHGVWGVRVHDAVAARDACHVVAAWQAAREGQG